VQAEKKIAMGDKNVPAQVAYHQKPPMTNNVATTAVQELPVVNVRRAIVRLKVKEIARNAQE